MKCYSIYIALTVLSNSARFHLTRPYRVMIIIFLSISLKNPLEVRPVRSNFPSLKKKHIN